jgi:hypothetical protein
MASRSGGRITARSVTSSPIATTRVTSGSASIAADHASKQSAAASGSQWTFHSETGVVLPGTRNAPPIMTQRRRSLGSAGSTSRAMARFVSGPSVTRVSSPGRRRASSAIRCGPNRDDGPPGAVGGSAYPSPPGPWVSGVIFSFRTSGFDRPAATSTSGRPARARIASVFRTTSGRAAFPAEHVTATSSASGLAAT